jgi:hypothetical protein
MGRCPRWGLVETVISHFGVSALILRQPLAEALVRQGNEPMMAFAAKRSPAALKRSERNHAIALASVPRPGTGVDSCFRCSRLHPSQSQLAIRATYSGEEHVSQR